MKLTPAQSAILSENEKALLKSMTLGRTYDVTTIVEAIYKKPAAEVFGGGERKQQQRVGAMISQLNKRKLPVLGIQIKPGKKPRTYVALKLDGAQAA